MNDEIKVNDYVRTNHGNIFKVYNIKNDFIIGKEKDKIFGLNYILKSEEITKHSPNIIDLVQKKDYVNGHLVLEVHENYVIIENSTASCYDGEQRIDTEDIKTIVTKEQFEKIMYEVGE